MPEPIKLITKAQAPVLNKISTIDVSKLPPLENLIMFGKKVEFLDRESLITAVYILARRLRQFEIQSGGVH
jgi:hypothetical protein